MRSSVMTLLPLMLALAGCADMTGGSGETRMQESQQPCAQGADCEPDRDQDQTQDRDQDQDDGPDQDRDRDRDGDDAGGGRS